MPGRGRRYREEVWLTHLPTQTKVVVKSEKPGGRTRAEARAARTQMLIHGLRELESQVAPLVKAQNRQNAVRRHG